MIRKIIQIDEEKCNGCGICAKACHEGAIAIIDGKAKLIRDDFCDGFGDCLPGCPMGAISFIEKDTLAYNEKAVLENKKKKDEEHACQCPGAQARTMKRTSISGVMASSPSVSMLTNWPVQIKLAPTNAPYFQNAKLLIAADCTAYAYARMHEDFIKGYVTLIGCPKLDGVDYTEKLYEILMYNDIQEVTIVRMEVPCCGGLERAAKQALQASGKFIPWSIKIISIDGKILD